MLIFYAPNATQVQEWVLRRNKELSDPGQKRKKKENRKKEKERKERKKERTEQHSKFLTKASLFHF